MRCVSRVERGRGGGGGVRDRLVYHTKAIILQETAAWYGVVST